jgi:hypothetical protein
VRLARRIEWAAAAGSALDGMTKNEKSLKEGTAGGLEAPWAHVSGHTAASPGSPHSEARPATSPLSPEAEAEEAEAEQAAAEAAVRARRRSVCLSPVWGLRELYNTTTLLLSLVWFDSSGGRDSASIGLPSS